MTDIPGTTDATFGRFNIFSDQLKILKAEIKEEEKRSTNLFSIYIFFFVFFSVLNVKLKKHRKGIGELRDTKAKYRDPQVCVCFIQADSETDSKPTFIKRSFQHQSLCCWKRFGSPRCCRLLQCSKRNCCQKTLKLVSST